jgi:hypothetical protein
VIYVLNGIEVWRTQLQIATTCSTTSRKSFRAFHGYVPMLLFGYACIGDPTLRIVYLPTHPGGRATFAIGLLPFGLTFGITAPFCHQTSTHSFHL